MGVPLEMALAAENSATINKETWKKALAAHPEFSPHYEAAKGKFLAEAMQRLVQAKELKHLCWLLERRHSDLFAKPAAVEVNVENTTNVSLAIPDDVLARARELARKTPLPVKNE